MKLIFPILIIFSLSLTREWRGINNKIKLPEKTDTIITKTKEDTNYIDRQVLKIPTQEIKNYIGYYSGVKCINCEPNRISISIQDSIKNREIKLRKEIWELVKKPIKNRDVYIYGNYRCFYFGYPELDTTFIAGEWIEIKQNETDCYPFLQIK